MNKAWECIYCKFSHDDDSSDSESQMVCKDCGAVNPDDVRYGDEDCLSNVLTFYNQIPGRQKVVPMEKLIVPRLRDIAFKVSYKEILNSLVLCRDHRPEEKQLKWVASSSFLSLNQFCTSQFLISLMRNRLDQFPIEVKINAEMRKKYVETFYRSFSTYDDDVNMVDPWVLLDCALDSTFEELETHVAFPDSEPNSKLVSTIAKRASLLQKLKLNFRFMMKLTRVEKVVPLFTSLSSLENLQSLNIYQLESSHKSVLKLIGNACPRLSHLSVSCFHLSPKDVLSIFLGEFADELFLPSSEAYLCDEEINLGTVKAPVQVLTPICLALRHLQFKDTDLDVDLDDCWTEVASFLLHHLPLLEKMDGLPTSFGIALMNGCRMKDTSKEGQVKFEIACKKFVTISLPGALSHSSENIPLKYPDFKGYLSLRALDKVHFTPLLLSTIPKFCPNLKEVVFCKTKEEESMEEESMEEEPMEEEPKEKNLGPGSFIEELVPPNDVVDYFKSWPKVEAITFMKVSTEYIKVVLNYFAPSLKRVTFVSCKNINLIDLIDCTQLESLAILKESSLERICVDFDRLSPSSFFPRLQSFESDICLEIATFFLEGKSELSHVVINCFHHHGPNGERFRVDWEIIPKLWPKLETLVIGRCIQLTMPTLANIVPQLKNLKQLSLPENTTRGESKLAVDIWEELNSRLEPVHFAFTDSYSACSCCMGRNAESIESEDSKFKSWDEDLNPVCAKLEYDSADSDGVSSTHYEAGEDPFGTESEDDSADSSMDYEDF